MRLFCFPHAGGGASAYRTWPFGLGEEIEVRPVQLPGRENRLAEPPVRRLEELLPRLVDAFADEWDVPFALFGHSMGALVAFELARELRKKWGRTPVALFVSGRLGPRELDPNPPLHELPEPAFLERLRRLRGTPSKLLEAPEMKELFFPTLRADFELCARYQYRPGAPLDCALTVLGGSEDAERPTDRLAAWEEETSGSFAMYELDGDHFFLRSSETRVLEILRGRLDAARGSSRREG